MTTTGLTVWTLTIDHRHGTDTTVHRSRKKVDAELLRFVQYWWADEVEYRHPGTVLPTDPDEAIATYFELVDTESYWIDDAPLDSSFFLARAESGAYDLTVLDTDEQRAIEAVLAAAPGTRAEGCDRDDVSVAELRLGVADLL